MPEQPVSYTTADGTKVYPKTVTKPDGSKELNTIQIQKVQAMKFLKRM